MAKMPDQPTNNSARWMGFDCALRVAAQNGAAGVGIVLGDGLVGIDLDACIDDYGELRDDAIDALALGSYCERSPSRHGLHVLIYGVIELPRKLQKREIYDGRAGSARFFAVTGDLVGAVTLVASGPAAQASLDRFVAKWFVGEETVSESDPPPTPIAEDDVILSLLLNQRDGGKAFRLFAGDWSGYTSQSEADLALCRKIAYYTLNSEQIGRLFRRSGLMRAKWDEKRRITYGDRTVATAILSARRGPLHYIAKDSSRARTYAHARGHERTPTQDIGTVDSLESIYTAREDDAIIAQRLLREGRFLSMPAPCPFFIGYGQTPEELCRRCSASWAEHYPDVQRRS